MAAPLRTLVEDYSRYLRAFQLFLDRSSEHQCMRDFIQGALPDILAGVGAGRDSLSVMGVGSGAGRMERILKVLMGLSGGFVSLKPLYCEIDLEMLRQLHLKHPKAKVDNEVVEPSGDMLHKYKVLVSKTPGLDHITFCWNKRTASEFEKDWRERGSEKQMDFIHMIQMLYYVKDPEATLSFFRSLLHKNGKLLIILVSGDSGWGRLWRTYRAELCNTDISQCVTTGDIRSFLDTKGIPYQKHTLPSQMDISEVFTEGDEKGELLLDFLTEVMDFGKSASPELKAGVLELLRHPDCSRELEGRIIFNNNLEALVLEP